MTRTYECIIRIEAIVDSIDYPNKLTSPFFMYFSLWYFKETKGRIPSFWSICWTINYTTICSWHRKRTSYKIRRYTLYTAINKAPRCKLQFNRKWSLHNLQRFPRERTLTFDVCRHSNPSYFHYLCGNTLNPAILQPFVPSVFWNDINLLLVSNIEFDS